MKKVLSVLLILLVLTTSVFAQATKEQTTGVKEEVSVNIAFPTGMPSVVLAKLANENTPICDGYKTTYEVVKQADLMSAKIINGDAEIIIAPTNLGSVLYNKGVKVQIAAPVVWGVLYAVTSDDSVKSIKDLKGKTVLGLGRGLTPDIIFRKLLKENGLTPDKDVMLTYVNSSADLAPSFISGKAPICIIPQPMLQMVMMKKPNTRIFLDFQKEWKEKVSKESYPQASIFINKDFAANNKEYVNNFLSLAQKSVEFANDNALQTGIYAEKLISSPPAKIISKAISKANIKYVDAVNAKEEILTYFNILKESNPKTIGGKLPNDDFFYKK